MHLKAYAVDGAVVRSGSANFSTSAERYEQTNDLVILRSPETAARFETMFSQLWDEAQAAE
jgi:phosphatidylserine/phosphatidylglycerophosphate/cardiolipin synthase-like enzyme